MRYYGVAYFLGSYHGGSSFKVYACAREDANREKKKWIADPESIERSYSIIAAGVRTMLNKC